MRSMTGYGRIEKIIGNYNYTVEIKSLNGKYLNLKTSLAGIFSPLELNVQNYLKKQFKRGNINVFVDIRFLNPSDFVEIDMGLAKSYNEALNKVAEELNLPDKPNLDILTKFRDVIKVKINEKSLEEVWGGLKEVLGETVEKVKEFQYSEGENLKTVITEYMNQVEDLVSKLEIDAGKIKDIYRERLMNNIEQVLTSKEKINEERLELEVVLTAERADISEEIDRLKSHIKKVRTIINSKDEVKGQNLDFLSQEMHREFNTIASKSKMTDITNYSVEGRVLINKIREQVQNIH
ncbi:hypothetical protein OSSY52_02340 [Tepiditoga spiralis]|uniref:YicC family protein n=1 Tax=Tepiditoga spiralis TaxID=2108365 RepID=A0A7G1G5N3_9BACT|nr:YicC/YloC family endoribonuclease [Tepiditoga spiralis]BBE30093.1 hypothetical protein OSSY52_02340 [Tepiditoga spiralis]